MIRRDPLKIQLNIVRVQEQSRLRGPERRQILGQLQILNLIYREMRIFHLFIPNPHIIQQPLPLIHILIEPEEVPFVIPLHQQIIQQLIEHLDDLVLIHCLVAPELQFDQLVVYFLVLYLHFIEDVEYAPDEGFGLLLDVELGVLVLVEQVHLPDEGGSVLDQLEETPAHFSEEFGHELAVLAEEPEADVELLDLVDQLCLRLFVF